MALALAKLVNRKLIRITGPDCYPYLQGLFCNDLRYLYEPDRVPRRPHAYTSPNVLNSFMLNAQGRVICDILVYRTPRTRFECSFTPPGAASEDDELLIECQSDQATGLANTLYGYRVRRKVSLEIITNKQTWCLYPILNKPDEVTNPNPVSAELLTLADALGPKEVIDEKLTIVNDPRLKLMGLRIVADTSEDFSSLSSVIRSQMGEHGIEEASLNDYITHRYDLGIGEGQSDHPEGNCLPLECNADLTGSVSFEKGCYLGQELTSRIHYTGVVRKRLMPCLLEIDKNTTLESPLSPRSDIIDESNGKKIGILRHVVRNRCLSLLRTDLIDEDRKLVHEATGVKITTWRPYWWQIS